MIVVSDPKIKKSYHSNAVPAAAGSFGGKYYLSLAGKVHVYDTKRGMWCTEDDCGAVDFATADGKLYIAAGKEDANGKYPLYEVSGDAEAEACVAGHAANSRPTTLSQRPHSAPSSLTSGSNRQQRPHLL